MSAIQVFISYAHKDVKAKDRLLTELKILEYLKLIKAWHDGEILPGGSWDDDIRDALGNSDIVILLISPDFAASSYIFTEELPLILERHIQGKIKVLPVLIRSTAAFEYIGIDHLQCLPHDQNKQLKAISSWANIDDAWATTSTGIIEIVKEMADPKEESYTEEKEEKKFKLGAYHKYACDRIDQRDLFYEQLNKKAGKQHYFYLYGELLQSHFGMFQRIVYDKQNLLLERLNSDMQASCQIVSREITFDPSNREQIYKQNIIKGLLASFHIALNEEEPILDKDVHILLDKSPELQELEAEDAVFILLTISEWDWDKEQTPKIVRWLLAHFFEVELPENAPSFYLFFGITYEEQDGEIEKEIEKAIKEGEHNITILPELKPVIKKDIKRWFARYKKIFKDQGHLKQMRERYFPTDDTVNMEEVERKLERIINDHNRRS